MTACLVTRCEITFVNKGWLLRHLPKQKVSTISTPLKVRRIKILRHKSEEFAALSLYFPENDYTRKLVYASVRCEIHLNEGLRVNLFIENDIISPENFVIDIHKKITLIGSYKVTILISTSQKSNS